MQAELAQLPWYHHIALLDKVKDSDQRIFYTRKAIENGWSRNVMVQQIETGLFERSGRAITNFEATLPPVQSDLAQQTIKNPYIFDFLTLAENVKEKELEKALIEHLKKFMLELGKGFAWLGSQKKIVVNGDDFFLDLLFYNYNMHCFVLFELKIGEFKPEFAGKLNFYVNAIDKQLKGEKDNPTIGILLCKTPNETVVKYSLQGIESPIGVTNYQFEKALPASVKSELPTVEELENEIEQSYKELKRPTDKKMDRLKELLKNLNESELREKKSQEVSRKIFEKVIFNLMAEMRTRYDREIMPLFQVSEVTVYIDGHGFPAFETAKEYFDDHIKQAVNEFRIEYRSGGFKAAGKKAFNCWTGLQLVLEEFKISFKLSQRPETILLEKLYHEEMSNAEEAALVEKWMEELLDDITFQLERI